MEKGYSKITSSLIRYMDKEKMEELDMFVGDALTQEYMTFQSDAEVSEVFGDMSSDFTGALSYNDALNLRTYTGFLHKEINATLRGTWNYEEHGLLTDEKKRNNAQLAEKVQKVLFRFPPLERSVKAYRGVTLAQFKPYGIDSLEDLVHMQGKYFYDSGFSSTSLVRSSSFYGTEAFQIGKRNIEIEYLIPESCHDGALLLNEYTSHYKAENEYLINSGSLIKIVSVDVDKANNTAFIRAVLIPKKIWDPMQVKYLEEATQQIKK